eukprot:COSAG01_NODE_3155_length_6492_cov_3.966995_10_plen_265_part_00
MGAEASSAVAAVDDGGGADTRLATNTRSYGKSREEPLSATQMYFRPALFWQPLFDEHVADAGLAFSLDVSTGGKRARFVPASGAPELEAGDPARLEAALAAAVVCVPDADARGDEAAVAAKLRAVATWGDVELVRRVLRSCWVTKRVATAALVEAAARGLADVCAVLIAAGAAPGGPKAAADWIPSKTAFHCACENGHEELAALLLASMSERCEVEVRVGGGGGSGGGGGGGLTAVELARQADLGGVARRVQALIDEKFPPLHV